MYVFEAAILVFGVSFVKSVDKQMSFKLRRLPAVSNICQCFKLEAI